MQTAGRLLPSPKPVVDDPVNGPGPRVKDKVPDLAQLLAPLGDHLGANERRHALGCKVGLDGGGVVHQADVPDLPDTAQEHRLDPVPAKPAHEGGDGRRGTQEGWQPSASTQQARRGSGRRQGRQAEAEAGAGQHLDDLGTS